MKRVLLLRHAKSSWSDDTLTDHERPLSKRGTRDAKRMAVYFEDQRLCPDYVLCSSATRARKSYALIARRFKHEPELVVDGALYLPTAQGLLDAIRNVPEHAKCVLVVGHSPSLDAVMLGCVSKRQPESRAQIAAKFPTGSLCVLELDAASFGALGKKAARIAALVTPADLDPQPREHALKARHAGAIRVGRKARVADAAELALSDCLLQIRENAANLAHDDTPEVVHQLRVGLRRLRVALNLFDSVIERAAQSSLDEDVRWLFREVGTVRERDVFLHDVLEPALALHKQPALLRLRKRLLIERHARLSEVRKLLTSDRYSSMLADALGLQAALDARDDSPRLKAWAQKSLNRRLRKVLALKDAIEQRDPSALHVLRRELKKLRYSAEFLQSSFPKQKSKATLKRVCALQDVLGGLHDVTVGEQLLSRGLKHLQVGRARTHAREALRTIFDGLATEHALLLPQSFAAFEQHTPFWV